MGLHHKAYAQSHLKEMNRKTVYELVLSEKVISKAEISRKTGISSPTVMKIVNHFIRTGLMAEIDQEHRHISQTGYSGPGRKPNPVQINNNAAFSIGVEFEGSYLKAGIFNLAHEMVVFRIVHVDEDFETVLTQKLPVLAEEMLCSLPATAGKRILGMGIGIPSIFDPETMVIEATPLIGIPKRIEAMGLLDSLKKTVNMPVFMENDVKAAAIGEYRIHGKGIKDMIYISLGTGVGAGIILDGVLRRGPHNMAGEIGYLTADVGWKNSLDHAGWLEQNANLAALGMLLGKESEAFDCNIDTDRAAMEKISGYIALAAANLCNALDVRTVILGGVLIELLGDPFVQRIHEQVNRLALMQVELSNYALMQPGVTGAAMIAMDHMLDALLTE